MLSTQVSATRAGVVEVRVQVPYTTEPGPFQPVPRQSVHSTGGGAGDSAGKSAREAIHRPATDQNGVEFLSRLKQGGAAIGDCACICLQAAPKRNSLNVGRPTGSPKKCSSALIAAPLNSGPLVVCFLSVPNAEESPANVPCYTLNSFSWSAPYRAVGIYEQTSGTPRSAGSGSRR